MNLPFKDKILKKKKPIAPNVLAAKRNLTLGF